MNAILPLTEAGITVELLPDNKIGVRPKSLTQEQPEYIRNNRTVIIRELELELIRGWLHKIGEPQEDHYLVLDKCRVDPEAMQYFMKHAKGI